MTKYKVNYRLTTESGELVDESENFEFSVGDGQLAPLLEKCIIEAETDKLQTVLLSGIDVFGHSDEKAIQLIIKKEMPDDIEIGSAVDFNTPTGDKVLGVVAKINEEDVLVDFNHPLSKYNIAFNFKVLTKL